MSPWNDEPKDPRHKGLYKVTQIGGGKKFVSFLEDELIPYIDKKYSITNRVEYHSNNS